MKLPMLFLVCVALALPSRTSLSAIFSYDEYDEDMSDEMIDPEDSDLYDEMVSLNVSNRNQNLPDRVPWNEDCFPAFDEHMTGKVKEAIQDCPSYLVGQRLRNSGDIGDTKKVPTAEECHILCLTFPECMAFKWNSVDTKCYLIKSTIGNNKVFAAVNYISGMRTSCTENLDNEVAEYFSYPNQRQISAKTMLSKAKTNYNVEMASRITYSKSLLCLPTLFKSGEITENELHTPSNFNTEEIPFLPLAAELMSTTLSITANSGPIRIPNTAGVVYQNWVMTGLYAPPGEIINVVIPTRAVGQVKIIIGVHTDKLYDETSLHRDPQVSFRFDMTKETQIMGSPYGGLIVVQFKEDNNLSGESIDIEFDNILEAPHFILGEHNNEDWNNHIKNRPAPWTVFEIPKSIIFIVPTRNEHHKGVQIPEDLTTTLEEWKALMKGSDEAAGVIDRAVAEILVLDEQLTAGGMHSGYPMMGHLEAINQIFPSNGRSIDSDRQSVGIGHEVGHNMRQKYYYLSHVTVNMFFFFALPATRTRNAGIWGRASRIFGYIKSGEQNVLDENNYDSWTDIMKIPMDGLDGLGWENDGSWNEFPALIASYKDLPIQERPVTRDDMMDLWAKKVCMAKQMNMIEYFEFWRFPLSASTHEACNQYTHEPTEIMAWIASIRHLAETEVNECQDGWSGHSQKCFKLTEEKFNYDGAKEYCENLGGGSALASISNRDDEILVDWMFFQSSPAKRFWVENVAEHATIFPQADNYEVEIGSHTLLGTPQKRPKCHYETTELALGGQTQKCLNPINKNASVKSRALCEISL